jgi:NAD(P)-dependent dehydrogenase (short-subunit alcohol dehydrogenase family)
LTADVSPAAAAEPSNGLPDLFDLTGHVAVVTGARRGIGLAIADALAAAGADIVAVSAHLDADGGEVARRVLARGREARRFEPTSQTGPPWPTWQRSLPTGPGRSTSW